jgi:hypothetical protein
MRVRFPSGLYVPVPQDWNMFEEWHSSDACNQISPFIGVRGYGPRGAPATSASLVFVLRGGSCSSMSEIRTVDPDPLLYDHWYDVVVHYVWKQSGGSVEWYVDGKLIYSNPNFPTLYTLSTGGADHPSFAAYNYRENQVQGSSEIDFDQTLIGPTAASIGFTP